MGQLGSRRFCHTFAGSSVPAARKDVHVAERKLDAQSVSDMLEINQNLSRNFMSTDEKSWKAWQNTFADELAIEFGGVKPPQKTAPKNLMDWVKKTYATVKTQHTLFDMDIHLDGDEATSKSHGHARHERTDNGDFWRIHAIYEHEHVRTTNGWRISKIKMAPSSQGEIPNC
jgi:SnoaL-like protein